jgi:hypothetical protein
MATSADVVVGDAAAAAAVVERLIRPRPVESIPYRIRCCS